MPTAVSILQQIGLAVLFAATVVWVIGLLKLTRHEGVEAAPRQGPRQLLDGVPRQTGPLGPPAESVELSAAEREAFEGLVRQLTSRY
ncbi:hypothetical protein [Streptomyces sp. x-80]|uniref:hypothetical protein n=1 Tax=Streptomyces sp. x-80 TaxID=2789282 RepID=UPI003980A223